MFVLLIYHWIKYKLYYTAIIIDNGADILKVVKMLFKKNKNNIEILEHRNKNDEDI